MAEIDLKEIIKDRAWDVARESDLKTGHARTTFQRLAVQTLERVEAQLSERTAAEIQKGTAAEKERIGGILKSAEAKDRMNMALELAIESDMDVEKARKILAATPKANPDLLGQLMRDRSPGISSDDGAPDEFGEVDEEENLAQSIINACNTGESQ